MTGLRAIATIAGKDLRLEWRTHDVLGSMGLFALLIVVTASFTLPTDGDDQNAITAGTLWMAVLFAGLLGIGRSQAVETEQRCLDTLLLAPIARECVFLGKLCANLIFSWSMALVLVPAFIVLSRFDSPNIALLMLGVMLGTIGLVSLGTTFGMVTGQTRMQQPLLPVLVMPIATPLMIASVQVSASALAGGGFDVNLRWLALLGGCDALFLLIAVLTVPYLVEE